MPFSIGHASCAALHTRSSTPVGRGTRPAHDEERRQGVSKESELWAAGQLCGAGLRSWGGAGGVAV